MVLDQSTEDREEEIKPRGEERGRGGEGGKIEREMLIGKNQAKGKRSKKSQVCRRQKAEGRNKADHPINTRTQLHLKPGTSERGGGGQA